MRNIIKFSFILCAVLSIFSCKDMDSTYKDLIVPGGIKYPQKPSNVTTHSGDGRIEISWDRGTDPSVSKAIVYWDNFTYSKEILISETDTKVTARIDDLVEKDYSFVIKTFDEQGNVSVPVEVVSKVYGDVYSSSIVNANRLINDAYYDNPNSLKIVWDNPESKLFKTQITYTTTAETQTTIELNPEEKNSLCTDYKPGTEISYISLFKPDSTCLDLFTTSIFRYTPDFAYEFKFDRSNWVATTSSSHPAGDGPGALLDDKFNASGVPSYWHSQHRNDDPNMWVAVDMKEMIIIKTLILTARKYDDWPTTRIQSFIMQGSNDGSEWTDIGTNPYTVTETTTGPMRLWFDISADEAYSRFRILITPTGDYVSFGDIDIRGFRP